MKKQVVVIGLGRFGTSLAETLAATGHDVLAIDRFEKAVQNASSRVTHAVQADATSETVLKELGVDSFDIGVVAIGTSIENSVLVTLLLKKLGVPRVIARATNELHHTILTKIGADMVVSPEFEMGRRLAHGAVLPGVSGYLDIREGYGIVRLTAPALFIGKSLANIGIGPGGKLGIAVLLIQRGKEIIINPAQSEVIETLDTLILAGNDEELGKLLTIKVEDKEKKKS